MREIDYLILDVFAEQAFGGNQLAVIPDGDAVPSELLQPIAREFNFSETVFLCSPTRPDADWRARIFTPYAEMDFAGHPTLGAAAALALLGPPARRLSVQPASPANVGTPSISRVVLEERAGLVPVDVRIEPGDAVYAELEAPRRPELHRQELDPADLARFLDLAAEDFLDLGSGPNVCSCGFPFLMAPVRSAAVVERAVLDAAAATRRLKGAPAASSVYLFAETAPGALVARMFAPADGIPEDPATGSAAAAVAGWLASRATNDGDYAWRIEQGRSLGRPSVLYARAERRSGSVERAFVGGRSRLFSRGKFRIP